MSSEDELSQNASLQYLNARYYDPKLALFLQPDWFEVQDPGVGTNRYSYSFNDPVNLSDPSGNATRVTDRDGDGDNEFFEHFAADSPEHAALMCGCRAGRAHMNAYDAQWGDLLGGLAADGVTSVSFTGTGFEVSAADERSTLLDDEPTCAQPLGSTDGRRKRRQNQRVLEQKAQDA